MKVKDLIELYQGPKKNITYYQIYYKWENVVITTNLEEIPLSILESEVEHFNFQQINDNNKYFMITYK